MRCLKKKWLERIPNRIQLFNERKMAGMHQFTLKKKKKKSRGENKSNSAANFTPFWLSQSGYFLSLYFSGTKQKIFWVPDSDAIDLRENLED